MSTNGEEDAIVMASENAVPIAPQPANVEDEVKVGEGSSTNTSKIATSFQDFAHLWM